MSKSLYIYLDEAYTDSPVLLGVLMAEAARGHEVFSMSLSEEWLHHSRCQLLDPDLQLYSGHQYLPEAKTNFGFLLDSSPDRWGRMLLERRETVRAKDENRPRKTLIESDFLLGVYDESRMGALRIKTAPDGVFMDNDASLNIPPIASIGQLEQASLAFEAEDNRWLQMLVAPGSSLGGARPKANVRMEDGRLWIAKFPSRQDRYDVGAWEAVAMTLAQQCGITVAPFVARRFSGRYRTFLTQRFDRNAMGQRLHFTSAMTMLGYRDGDTAGCSYLELADWISRHCCQVDENLRQMWRRMVFNIAISNCDDHLRNHGFLLGRNGWTLTPAYDLNPTPYGQGLSLNINEYDNALDMGLALEIASYFGIGKQEAQSEIENIRSVVSNWEQVANRLHISREEWEQIRPAFQCK